jgi:hypothetical protein
MTLDYSEPAPKSKMLWKIVFVLFAAGVAHVAASYICLYFTLQRIEQMASLATNPRQIYVSRGFKVGAPVRIFKLVNAWRRTELDTPRGIAFLAATYVLSAGGIFVLTLLSPKLIVNDEKPRSRNNFRKPAAQTGPPAATAAPSAPAAAPAPATTPPPARPPAATPTPPRPATANPPPPARPATTAVPPPRPTTVTPPPPARGGTPPPPRTVTPPPPARGVMPPRPRRDV